MVDAVVERLAAGDQRQRVEIALVGDAAGRVGSTWRIERPVERQRVADAARREARAGSRRRRARRRSPSPAAARLQAPDHAADRLERQRLEEGRRQAGAKALEDLHRLRARIDLADEIGGRGPRPACRSAHP